MEHTHTVTCKRSRLTFLTLCWEKKKKGDAKDIQNTGVYHYCCWNLNNILLVLSYLRHLTVCSGTTVDTNTLTEGNPLQHFKDLLDTMQTYCTTLELLAAVMNVSHFALHVWQPQIQKSRNTAQKYKFSYKFSYITPVVTDSSTLHSSWSTQVLHNSCIPLCQTIAFICNQLHNKHMIRIYIKNWRHYM